MCDLRPIVSKGNPIVHGSWTDIDEHPRPRLVQTHKERVEEIDEDREGKELAGVCVSCEGESNVAPLYGL
jgi:hypothetical protein